MSSSVFILIVLVLGQFFLTAMYYAITYARKKTLKERLETGSKQVQHTLNLAEQPNRLLSTHQYLSMVAAMVFAAILVTVIAPEVSRSLQRAGMSLRAAEILSDAVLLPVCALLLLIVGHQLPIALISGRTEGFAIFVTLPMRILVNVLSPILDAAQILSQRLGKLLGGSGITTHIITEEELKTLMDAVSEDGIIEDDEKDMIYSVFKFRDTLVREVMVPRIDIVGLEVNDSLDKALDSIIQAGHSRIPVYEQSIDNIKGFLYAKDLLTIWRSNDENPNFEHILREAYFVPETKKADDLLEEFQTRETHIAIVIDEYGGTAGLVTIEDLVEEIVGEIRDEYDFQEEAPYEAVSETEYICNAGIDLDDLNDLLDISLPTSENDTLGGYIFSHLGRVPEVGYKLTTHGIEIEVLTLKGRRRINKVRVKKLLANGEPESEAEVTPTK